MVKKTTPQSRRVAITDHLEFSSYLEIAQKKVGLVADRETELRKITEGVVIIDFGSQYSHLIARRVRELNVYCEVISHTDTWDTVEHINPKGVILSGGPSSVYDDDAPLAQTWVYEKRLPILGICYGMQVLAHQLGGSVSPSTKSEYGHAVLHQNYSESPLFGELDLSMPVWMSHGDQIQGLPPGFKALGYTDNSPIAVMGDDKDIFGIQFHPEVAHTPQGKQILKNFLVDICGCRANWTSQNVVSEAVEIIKERVGDGKVLCALSGGVDSAVTAALVHQAVGDQLICIFVNNGLLRLEEAERVQNMCGQHLNMNFVYVDASQRFIEKLKGVIDPEDKRKKIGEEFIRVFEDEAASIPNINFLAQGTLYSDVIESKTSETKSAAKIKTHHNVGGLPKEMKLKLLEPLRNLFKDEIRGVGRALDLPESIINRQPFPGPGLAIRVLGEVTEKKLEILRACDWIVIDEIKAANLYDQLWQAFAVLTDARSVGVMGDSRTYGHVVAIRAVKSDDAMTADWARLPYEVLSKISSRIVNEVPEVNRVTYDITSKPPGTIEWE
jgi:GMP synthase (glutamine-hydrolysing)